MKKSIANKWIKALRSGKYKQGSLFLSRGGKFCCLGVLCEISKNQGWKDYTKVKNNKNQLNKTLPDVVKLWSGMQSFNGRTSDGGLLTDRNDRGVSFAEIADIIKKEWKTL